MSKATCAALAILFAACAMGSNPGRNGDDASVDPIDAPKSTPHDAAVPHDAPATMHDAPVVPHDAPAVPHDAPPVDANEDGFCTGNDQCGSGYCCYIAVCVQGTALGALCFPSS